MNHIGMFGHTLFVDKYFLAKGALHSLLFILISKVCMYVMQFKRSGIWEMDFANIAEQPVPLHLVRVMPVAVGKEDI